jgi:hypothetical protein
MRETITPEEAAIYLERWRLACQFEREKVLRMSPEAKLRQVEILYEMAEALGWPEDRGADVERVRERWRRLREAAGGESPSAPDS